MSNTNQQFQDDIDQIDYLANDPLRTKPSPHSQLYNEPPPMNGLPNFEPKATLHPRTNLDAAFYMKSGLTDNKSISVGPPSGTGFTYDSSA